MIKTCSYCGKSFNAKRRKQKYCSVDCANNSLKVDITAICSICGKEYITKPHLLKQNSICSKECGIKSASIKRQNRKECICPVCGKKFNIKVSHWKENICCSKECSNIHKLKRNNILIKDNYAIIEINSPKWGYKEAIIDVSDIDIVKQYTWQVKYTKDTNCFYVTSSQCNKNEIKLHRLLMQPPKNMVIDHINHNPLDNRRINLRICTQKINSNNQSLRKDNKSGYAGIRQTKSGNFVVYHSKNSLGTYSTMEEAIKVKQKYVKRILDND